MSPKSLREQERCPASWPSRFNSAALLPTAWAPPAALQSQWAAIRRHGILGCCDHSSVHGTLCPYLSWGAEHFRQLHCQSTTGLVPSHTCAGVNPLLLTSRIHPQRGFECSSHPFSAGTVIFLSETPALRDFDFRMNNDNEEDQKKKTYLIFSVYNTHFVLLPPSSFLL